MKQNRQKLGKHIDFYRGQYRARIIIPPKLRPFILKADGSPQGTALEKFLGSDPRAALKASHAVLADFHDRLDRARLLLEAANSNQSADSLALPRLTIAGAAKEVFRSELDFDLRSRIGGPRHISPQIEHIYIDKLRLVAAGLIKGEEAEALVGYAVNDLAARGLAPSAPRSDLLRVLASVRLDSLAISQSRDKKHIRQTFERRNCCSPTNRTPYHSGS